MSGQKLSPTSSRSPEATKADILDVARTEFAANGFSGASINVIAEKTKTSKRMIYYYFDSKEGLYQSVIDANYQMMRDLDSHVELERVKPTDALIALITMTFDFHQMHPEFVRLIAIENIHNADQTREISGIRQRNVGAIETLQKICERGAIDGTFRSDIDSVNLHLTISALCFHYVSNRETFSILFDFDMKSSTAVAIRRQIIIDLILRYIRPL